MFYETKIIQSKLLLSTLLSVYLVNGFASPDDELVITGDLVNFRSAASSNSAVTTKLPRASKLVEIQPQGDWVEVETGRRDIKTAWVHGSLLSRTTETKIGVIATEAWLISSNEER